MTAHEEPHNRDAVHHHDEEQMAEKPASPKKLPGQGLTMNLRPKETEMEDEKKKQERVLNLLDPTPDDDRNKLSQKSDRPWLRRPKRLPVRKPRYIPETSADWDTPITGVSNLPNTEEMRRK